MSDGTDRGSDIMLATCGLNLMLAYLGEPLSTGEPLSADFGLGARGSDLILTYRNLNFIDAGIYPSSRRWVSALSDLYMEDSDGGAPACAESGRYWLKEVIS